MAIQIFSLSLLWQENAKGREKKASLSLARSPILFFSQWRTFRNCSDIHSVSINVPISDWARRQTSRLLTMETNVVNAVLILLLLDISPMAANDPFDFRFVSYAGMYMWESTPSPSPRQTRSTTAAYTWERGRSRKARWCPIERCMYLSWKLVKRLFVWRRRRRRQYLIRKMNGDVSSSGKEASRLERFWSN